MILKDVYFVTVDNEYYLLSDESVNPLWCFSVNEELVIGEFNDLIGEEIDWVKNVVALPFMIGYFSEKDDNDTFKMIPLNNEYLEKILKNGNKCKIEVEVINTENIIDFNPSIHNSFTPVLLNNKVIMHIDEI
jgi:hypothetical protein